jgi:hypothetical protein
MAKICKVIQPTVLSEEVKLYVKIIAKKKPNLNDPLSLITVIILLIIKYIS